MRGWREIRGGAADFDPGYGISTDDEGMLPWSWADERLEASRNYWIVTAAEDGEPSSAPVWGVWVEGAVYFGTSPARARDGISRATRESSSISRAATRS